MSTSCVPRAPANLITPLEDESAHRDPEEAHAARGGMSYTCVTIRSMSKTLTIRLPDAQDEALTTRAKALGLTRSELVRELIEKGLDEQPLGRTIGHLRGRLSLSQRKGSWPGLIKDRNWR